MADYKYIILGAGPAGLTFANKLRENGINSFLVIEKENEAGGLCRDKIVDGAALDIGGGHFLDVRNKEVDDYLFNFLPADEWNYFERDSRIRFQEYEIDHPFEANIWQLPEEKQNEYLDSISAAGCNSGKEKPEKFVDWITWKLGDKIAEDYMLPYNQKMFSDELNELGTYWLDKLPNVSFEDTFNSCRDHHAYGKQPGHAQFLYPKKYGYGEVWRRMANAISANIVYNCTVEALDVKNKTVTCGDKSWSAETIITTIPWKSVKKIEGFSDEVLQSISRLKHSSVEIKYYPETMDTDAHWIYYPDNDISYHRILVRSNFCLGSKGYWTETRKERITDDNSEFAYMNDYAYPLNTIEKPDIMKGIISEAESNGVYPLGRWGEHMHYNSDVTVSRALEMAKKLISNN